MLKSCRVVEKVGQSQVSNIFIRLKNELKQNTSTHFSYVMCGGHTQNKLVCFSCRKNRAKANVGPPGHLFYGYYFAVRNFKMHIAKLQCGIFMRYKQYGFGFKL